VCLCLSLCGCVSDCLSLCVYVSLCVLLYLMIEEVACSFNLKE
jgi:hypothetical protein